MLSLAPSAQAQSLPGVPVVDAVGCGRLAENGSVDDDCVSGAVIRFSWTAPSDTGGTAITGYDYQLKATTESAYGSVTNVGADVLSAEPSGLNTNTAYDFQVRAKNSNGDGEWATLRVSGRPAAPGGLAVDGTRTGGSEVTLTWSAPSAATAITAYVLEHRLETSSDHADWVSTVVEGDPAPTTGTVMGLEPSTEYEFRIRADTEHRRGWYSGDDPYPTATTSNVELTSISGEAAVTHPENWPGRVAAYSASSPADAAGVSWTLSGADASRFSIDSPGGVLRFNLPPPDYENPDDVGGVMVGDGVYAVTVQAEAGGASQSLDVQVTVSDEPEPGTLTLSSTRPGLGDTLTATLNDPDGMRGAVSYVWERSAGRGGWETLAGTAAAHVAGVADTGRFLRVTATYTDGPGATANSASAETKEVVTAARLSALSVSTNASTAKPSLGLKPLFDPAVLHYSIGCSAGGDTMTLTPTAAAAGVRLSIDGTQVASGESHTVSGARDGDEFRITVARADGAATDYFVRCTPEALLNISIERDPGATGVIEGLIMLGGCRSAAVIDPNGATRWYHSKPWTCGYFRAAWVPAANGYRYLYPTRPEEDGPPQWQILDENLEDLELVTTVAPLKTTDYHDALILDNGDYLLIAYEPNVRNLEKYTFSGLTNDGTPHTFTDREAVEDSVIQIRTPGPGGVSQFVWNSYDAIPFEDCGPRFPPRTAPGGGVDYAHINTVQMIDGEIVASFRGCNQVLRIDPDMAGADKVVWRVGLTNLSDEQWQAGGKGPAPLRFVGDAEGQFCGQHGSALLPGERLLLFDNGIDCMPDPWTGDQLVARTGAYSRAVEYALDHDNREAVFVRDHSSGGTDTRMAHFHGHVEALDNGDWLVGWGGWSAQFSSEGQPPDQSVTQVDPDTGQEKLRIKIGSGQPESVRALPLSPTALAEVSPPLTATVVAGDDTSNRHTGASDRPTVAVAFNRPVTDFTATTSVSIVGASVESIDPLVKAGAPAHAYKFILEPDGDDAITFTLLADQQCGSSAGVCTADGTVLTEVPSTAHAIASPTNAAPTITSDPAGPVISVAENTAASMTVATLTADDTDTQDMATLSTTLSGADAADFSLSEAGVLTFNAVPDHEEPTDADTDNGYEVTITATSGAGARKLDATLDLTVTVTDVAEPPGKPAAPTVTSASATSLAVAWTAPDNAGPNITGYNVQYRAGDSGPFTSWSHTGTALTTTITGLATARSYQVQVQAINAEGTGAWSNSGTGTPTATGGRTGGGRTGGGGGGGGGGRGPH